MKVFLFRFNSPMLIEAARELQRSGIEIVYWSGWKRYYEELVRNNKEFPKTIFYNTLDAVRGVGAKEVNTSVFTPLDADLLKKLQGNVSQVLTMMSGADLEQNIPLLQQVRLYHEYIRYWHGVLTKYRPDAVLFGDIPHLAYHFVVYRIAQMLGIKTLMYRVLQIPGRLLFLRDHETYSEVKNGMGLYKGKNFTIEDLPIDIQSYYKKQAGSAVDTSPFYMKKEFREKWEKAHKIVPDPKLICQKVAQHLRRGTIIKIFQLYLHSFFARRELVNLEDFSCSGLELKRKMREWKKIRDDFKKEYERLQAPVDWNKKFVYVALHKQPECSTSAMGGVFVDQLLMIDILSSALPGGWVLFVKESPMQWVAPRAHLGRYPGYYKEILKRKNVVLIPVNTSTYDLINKSQAVATVTGTAGWEAILRGKPALVFGYIFYMYCSGVFIVRDLDSCRDAFEKIQAGYKPDKQQVLNYLAIMDKISLVGYPNIRFKGDLKITDEENGRNIAREFMKKLNP